MNHVERIAFAMFKSDYPEHIANEMKPDRLGVVETPVGDGDVLRADLALDWDLNRESYMRLASAALIEVNEIVAERQAS